MAKLNLQEIDYRDLSEKAQKIFEVSDRFAREDMFGDCKTIEEINEAAEYEYDDIFPQVEIGVIYEDPEGVWEVTAVESDKVTVKQVQEGNLNFGKECVVSAEEALFFMGPGWEVKMLQQKYRGGR